MNQYRYLGDFCRALLSALWRGFERTDTVIVVLIVIAFIWSYAGHAIHDPWHPPGWLVTVIAALFIIYHAFLATLRLYSEERSRREILETRLTPQIIARTPILDATVTADGRRANYVRVPIENTSEGEARRTSARLSKIEYQEADDEFSDLGYRDNLDMPWSNKTAETSREISIHRGSTEYLDVVFGVEGTNEMLLATILKPYAYRGLMQRSGNYGITFQVTTLRGGALNVQMRIHWDGSFDRMSFPADSMTIV
ncbi:MAG: hypothetical protein ACLQKK_15260 [Rhodomicrobium sp.]